MAHNGRLLPPLSVIASWPPPNLIDPATRHGLLPACIILAVVSLIAVSARFYARAVILRKIGWDDWVLLAAMIPTYGLTAGIILGAEKYKFGYHVWDIINSTFVPQRKLSFALEIFYMLGTSLTKMSILIFYLRLSAGPTLTKPFRRLVHFTMALILAYLIAFMLALLLACRPLRAYWLSYDFLWSETHDFQCDSQGASLLAATSTSVVIDFIIVVIPIMLLWHLENPRRQKLGLFGVFGVGLFTCLAGLVRIRYVYILFYQTWDATWVLYDLWIWTAVEALMATICASAPALKVYLRNTSLLPTSSSSHNKPSALTSGATSFHMTRSPLASGSRTVSPAPQSLPSSNEFDSGEVHDEIMVIGEKGLQASKGAVATSMELRRHDSREMIPTIHSSRQASPQREHRFSRLSTQEERRTAKNQFDSLASWGRFSLDADVERLQSMRSVDSSREQRLGVRRGNSMESAPARSRASLLGEVRIERTVEVLLEDQEGGQGGGRGYDLRYR